MNCGTFNVSQNPFSKLVRQNFRFTFCLYFFACCYVQTVFMNLNFVCFIFIVFAQQLGFFWFGCNLDVQLKSHVISCFVCSPCANLCGTYTIRVRMPTFPREFTVYTGLFFEVLHCKVYFWFWVTHTLDD